MSMSKQIFNLLSWRNVMQLELQKRPCFAKLSAHSTGFTLDRPPVFIFSVKCKTLIRAECRSML
jgi:hypothetical protein